jgi:hypothetical protein
LREQYGLSLDDYEALMAAQKHACAICLGRRPYNLDIDHRHDWQREGRPPRETVRGLLCKTCNRHILRHARDNAALLRRAADYLEDPPARRVLG